MTDLEKLVRKREKEFGSIYKLDTDNMPELVKNDVTLILERCKTNGWKYSSLIDWTGSVTLFVSTNKYIPEKYTAQFTFNLEGFITHISSEAEFDLSDSIIPEMEQVLRRVEDDRLKVSDLPDVIEKIKDIAGWLDEYKPKKPK